jgi:hypothetical protein
MIIETDEHRELLKTELAIFEWADGLARLNRHYTLKCASIIVKNAQIICGNIASFRSSTYNKEEAFHPETTIIDGYSAELEDLSLYVVKFTLDNEPLASRPCVKCMKEILAAPEITKLYYRNEKLRLVKEVLA